MSRAAVEDLFDDLRAACKNDALGSQQFLPHDVLDTTITAERIKTALYSPFPFGSSSLPKNIAQHAQKVFAILVLIGEPQAIKDLWKQGLRDEHLPLSAGSGPKDRGKLMAADGNAFGALKTGARVSKFLDCQWLLLAPVIDTTGQHFPLNTKCAMPFVHSDEIGGGAFSYVHKCELHKAHQKGLKVENGKTHVAVKQFKIKSNPKAFHQEKGNLERLKGLDHPHMIRHYATCEIDKTYYAIFPWADGGNLTEYWKNSDYKARTSDLALWILRQMLGLAEALAALHKRNCRHGDLKPENILRFNTATDPILVIGDVGVSRFHTHDTFVRTKETTTAATTPSYEAPEAYGDSREKRSRIYDIWSLGCIFLEFTIWFLFDFDAIMAFQQARTAPDKQSYFYKPTDNGNIGVHPKVTGAIDSLLLDPRCEPGTPFGDLVTLISNRLLQVEVKQRATAAEVASKLQEFISKNEASKSSMAKSTERIVSKPEVFQFHGKRPLNHGPKDSVMETSSLGLYGA